MSFALLGELNLKPDPAFLRAAHAPDGLILLNGLSSAVSLLE